MRRSTGEPADRRIPTPAATAPRSPAAAPPTRSRSSTRSASSSRESAHAVLETRRAAAIARGMSPRCSLGYPTLLRTEDRRVATVGGARTTGLGHSLPRGHPVARARRALTWRAARARHDGLGLVASARSWTISAGEGSGPELPGGVWRSTSARLTDTAHNPARLLAREAWADPGAPRRDAAGTMLAEYETQVIDGMAQLPKGTLANRRSQ